LNLVLPDFPDIFSSNIDLTYDSTTDVLSARGFSLQIEVDAGVQRDILNGTFTIDVTTTSDSAATGIAGDDLFISGDIDLDGDSVIDVSGTLLTGEVSLFGATVPGLFEFVFDVTGGELAELFFTQGQAGVILGAQSNSTFTGSFDVDFGNLVGGQAGTGAGNSDTAPVPEPGTLLLIGAGIAGLVGFGRRERRTAKLLAGAGLALALSTGTAHATLLSQPLQLPLLSFDNGGILNYDASADSLRIDAFPIAIRLDSGSAPRFITPVPQGVEFFRIGAEVDDTGALVGGILGDDLEIVGAVDLDGDGTNDAEGTLLTAEVTKFGFLDIGATDLYDFEFVVTGGELAELLGGIEGLIGVAVQSERSSFAGSFETSFDGRAKGTLGVVPEPTTLVLLGSGVLGLTLAGRRRRA
jgi:hypothetical protein